MTRIYEALEQFDYEQSQVTVRSNHIPQIKKCDIELAPALTETLVSLYRTIFTLTAGPGGRVVQFVETGKEGSCSNIIRAFANVSTNLLKKSVLLLDSDPQVPSDFDFFNQASRLDWLNNLANNDTMSNRTQDNKLLSVSRLSMESGLLPSDSEMSQTQEFMDKLKQTFDLTLVDSWSVSIPARPTLFSPYVDGLVLVVDEGKTRWQIIERQKNELVSQGGNVLGVILNNRTYPIPESIYNRL